MDLGMPEMNGQDASRIILDEVKERKCETSIVAVTSFTNAKVEQECLEIGMKRVCNKPLRPETL